MEVLVVYCELGLLLFLPCLTARLLVLLSSILPSRLLPLFLGLGVHCSTDEDLRRLVEGVASLPMGSAILNLHLPRPCSTYSYVIDETHLRELHSHL